jgi:hypothetical protein
VSDYQRRALKDLFVRPQLSFSESPNVAQALFHEGVESFKEEDILGSF